MAKVYKSNIYLEDKNNVQALRIWHIGLMPIARSACDRYPYRELNVVSKTEQDALKTFAQYYGIDTSNISPTQEANRYELVHLNYCSDFCFKNCYNPGKGQVSRIQLFIFDMGPVFA